MRSRLPFFLTLLVLLLVYTGIKLNQIFPHRKLKVGITTVFLFATLLCWQFVYRAHDGVIGSTWFTLLAWFGGACMGFMATFWLLSMPLDFLTGLYLGLRSLRAFLRGPARRARSVGRREPDLARREILTRWVPSGVLGISGVTATLGLSAAIRGPKTVRVRVPIEGLPEGLAGLKIAQISDLHIGPTIDRNYVQNVVQQVLELKPDLIALTGDMADGSVTALERLLEPLSQLRAPLGSYFVTGNHEYYWNAPQMIEKLASFGITALLNSNRILQFNGTPFLLAGVTDTSSEQYPPHEKSSPKKAVEATAPTSLKILLAHRPESCFEAAQAGFQLQLSGHTHAGQFFPWNMVVSRAIRFYKGLNREANLWVYTNAGTGYWGPPNRFAVPSEITLVEITRAPV